LYSHLDGLVAEDQVGNRIFQTDSNLHTTHFEYDEMGRETARVLPDGSRETKTYYLDGWLKTHTDFRNRTTTYAYQPETGRLATKTYDDMSTVSHMYPDTGRRNTVTDARGITTFHCDDRDRVDNVSYPMGGR
jgi:YD repeat-containing protein